MLPSQKVKIGIFILGYQVEKKIYNVISQFPKEVYDSVESIIIIDNHSSDNTVNEIRRAIQDTAFTKIELIVNEKNRGYGGSQKIAFEVLSKRGMDYAILFHGDGQGDLEALKKLISLARLNQYDFVIGSRFVSGNKLHKKYPLSRRLGNRLFVQLQRWVSGVKMTDPGSGELAYYLPFLKKIPYQNLTDGFHFTPQLMLLASEHPIRFIEFPIFWGESDVSSVNIWRHGWEMLRMLVSFRFNGVRLENSPLN